MPPSAADLHAFRRVAQPALLAAAWLPEADAESRPTLAWLAAGDAPGWADRLLDDAHARRLDALGHPAALQLLVEVLLLERLGVGPERGWLRPRAGGRSPAWEAALTAVRARCPQLGEAAWAALASRAWTREAPRLGGAVRAALLEVCRAAADAPAPVDAPAGVPLARAAAAGRDGRALYLAGEPVPVEGHPDWALEASLRPTLERNLYLLHARLVARTPGRPAPVVRLRLELRDGARAWAEPWRVAPDPPEPHEEYLELPPGCEVHLRIDPGG